MPHRSVSSPQQRTRKQSSEEINRVMERFPLILDILGQLQRGHHSYPGDADIHHGCLRALTGILHELAIIQPAPAGKLSKAEETAQSWLSSPSAAELIDADILQRMQQFIDSILGENRAA